MLLLTSIDEMRVHSSLESTDGLVVAIVMLPSPMVGGAMTLPVEHLGDERQQRVQRLKVSRLA
jgi:hypothetical protein